VRSTQTEEKDGLGRLRRSIDGSLNTTSYRSDAFDRMVQIKDAHGNTINTTFNARGFKVRVDDPDTGTSTFESNALGQVIRSVDNAGSWVENQYDDLGRVVNLTSKEGSSLWEFDKAPGCIGKLGSAERSDGGYREDHNYDKLCRATNSTVTVDGAVFVSNIDKYDDCSRVEIATDPGGFALTRKYDEATGIITQLVDGRSDFVYWSLGTIDAHRRITNSTLGNGVSTTKLYNASTRQIKSIVSSGPVAQCLQQMEFEYDPIGNLISRQDHCIYQSPTEDFEYDALNRLVLHDARGKYTLKVDYDAIGNIVYKEDSAGTYGDARTYKYCDAGNPPAPTPPTPAPNQCDPSAPGGCNVCQECCGSYLKDPTACNGCVAQKCPKVASSAAPGPDNATTRCTVNNGGAGPHAVREILSGETKTRQSYMQYNSIGSMVSSDEHTASLSRQLTYDSLGQTVTASRGGFSSSFTYSHAGVQVTRVDVDRSGGKTTTIKLANFEHVTKPDGSVQCRHHAMSTVQVSSACDGSILHDEVMYIGHDQQGSVSIVMDSSGALLEGEAGRQSYDAFGLRRFGNWTAAPRGHDWGSQTLEQGYTGPSELGGLGLVQTPARMYDPYLGRFLSADPTIQNVQYSQSINRYSYAGNNPLALTDPSGFGWFSHLWHGISHFFSHIWHKIEHAIVHSALLRDVIMVVLACVPGGQIVDALLEAAWSVMLTRIEGGSWSAALKAGCESLVTSAVMLEVGTLANGVVGAPPQSWVSAIEHTPGKAIGGDLGRALMHGVAQGGINVAEGKKFAIGFETAFVSCALAPVSQAADTMTNSNAAGDVVAGAVGGLASKMGGGRFEDGFVTGALFQRFNEDAHKQLAHKQLKQTSVWTEMTGFLGRTEHSAKIGVEKFVVSSALKKVTPENPEYANACVGADMVGTAVGGFAGGDAGGAVGGVLGAGVGAVPGTVVGEYAGSAAGGAFANWACDKVFATLDPYNQERDRQIDAMTDRIVGN
jgi:RHS repeat-associated protein